MSGHPTCTPALYLPELDQELVRELWALDPDDGWFAPLLRRPRPALIVVALDEVISPVAWAIAERGGLVGVYVERRLRRRGIGGRCLRRVYEAALVQWPDVEFYAMPPGRVGRLFFEAHGFRRAA